MKKKKRIALALAAALMMVLLLAACSDKTIRLGVAGIGGVYQVFGEDYAALQAQNGGRKLEVRETAKTDHLLQWRCIPGHGRFGVSRRFKAP